MDPLIQRRSASATLPIPVQRLDADEEAGLRHLLKRCSAATVEAAIQFRKSRDVSQLTTVVIGVLERFIEPSLRPKLIEIGDGVRLEEDLGVDSLTAMEIVIVIEDVLQARIDNDEVRNLHTLRDVKSLIEKRLRNLSTREVAKEGPYPEEFFSEQLGQLVGFAKRHGLSTHALLNATSNVLGPVIAEEVADGFATAEEGLNALLTAAGGVVSTAEASKLYKKPGGVKRQTLNGAIQNGTIIAYQSGQRGYLVPVWQFRPEGGLLRGLDLVLQALHGHAFFDPLLPFTFLLQENPLTGGDTPLNALRAGRLEEVVSAAKEHGR